MKNIIKHKITSIIGLLLMIAAGALLFLTERSVFDAVILFVVGLFAVYSKDDQINAIIDKLKILVK